MGQVVRVVPRIYAALEDRQEDHQSAMVEVAGKIVEQSVSILMEGLPVVCSSYFGGIER